MLAVIEDVEYAYAVEQNVPYQRKIKLLKSFLRATDEVEPKDLFSQLKACNSCDNNRPYALDNKDFAVGEIFSNFVLFRTLLWAVSREGSEMMLVVLIFENDDAIN